MRNAMRLTLPRLKEILRRQDPPKWGCNYDPAIRATREEAPARSRFAQVWHEGLGRYCHVLSNVEQKALLLAMFNSSLFELQEQRILDCEPRPHPLASHPLAAGLILPPLRGTIDVCERLDMLERHLWIYVDHPDGSGRVPVPTPFVGDFLLCLQDQDGPYCVNWTIKGTINEFHLRIAGSKPAKSVEKEMIAVRARHAIEELYYRDAHIPTIQIVDRDIPEMFIQNIKSFLLLKHRATDMDQGLYKEICERLQASVLTAQPPLEILLSIMHRHNLTLEIVKAAFYRALWQRDVRVELMDDAIFIDRPLKLERRDPLQVFSAWFIRQRP